MISLARAIQNFKVKLYERRNGMKAIGYVWVSTEDQAQSGVSLEAQEEKIRAYCLAKGWDQQHCRKLGGGHFEQ